MEEMSNEDINKIVDIRSAGSNQNSKNTIIMDNGDLEFYTSIDFSKWPINDEYYEAGIVNGKVEE